MQKIAGETLKGEINNLKGYLRMKGVPAQMIEAIRVAFINEALQEANGMKYDRIYSAIALMLRRTYGFGHTRILRGMREFDSICGSVTGDNAKEWEDLMAELDDETGIVIRTDDDNDERLICEYMGKTYKRAMQITEEQRRAKMDKCEAEL